MCQDMQKNQGAEPAAIRVQPAAIARYVFCFSRYQLRAVGQVRSGPAPITSRPQPRIRRSNDERVVCPGVSEFCIDVAANGVARVSATVPPLSGTSGNVGGRASKTGSSRSVG